MKRSKKRCGKGNVNMRNNGKEQENKGSVSYICVFLSTSCFFSLLKLIVQFPSAKKLIIICWGGGDTKRSFVSLYGSLLLSRQLFFWCCKPIG